MEWKSSTDKNNYGNVVGEVIHHTLFEDGTIVKVRVDLDRVGIATNFTNPDGTPHYAINTSVKLSITPKDKKFSVAKNSIKGKQSTPPNQMFG